MKIKFYFIFLFVLLFQTVIVFGQTLSPNTSGSFVFTPTGPLSTKPITVFYHIPNGNITTMPILLSFHGDERNGSSYRDYWISMANANGFMVFAPEYSDSENFYPGGNGYQLGNVFIDGDNPSPATLNATNLWTFSTVDPLFESIKTRVLGTQQTYDAWGHSGGAQFLQRFRMYLPNSKLNTAICSNAGWYTVPENAVNFPYGLANGQISNGNLIIGFSKKLIVHLGLNDTDPNSPGIRHNTTVDNQQGLFRLARGRYFFNTSLTFSQTLSNTFNWQREEVTGVGHDPQLMANDALRFLFQPNSNAITYSILDGGFENQAGGTIGNGSANSNANLSTSAWTTNTNANNTRVIQLTGGRTGPKYAQFGPSGTGNARVYYTPQLPTGVISPNTSYQIQYFYKTTSTAALEASSVNIYVNNTSATQTQPILPVQNVAATFAPNIASWTKVSVGLTTNATAAGVNGLASITLDASPSGTYTAEIDDFVIYQDSAPDNTAPNPPGAITAIGATNGNSDVSWGTAPGGVDGGGYVVVRFENTIPSLTVDPIVNGIYSFNNTIAPNVFVRYLGTGTSFTDSGLSPGVNYYYKVYTVDKAFNYSIESTSGPVQALATTYYYKGTGLLTDLSRWGLNPDGTGTAPTNFTATSQVFEIRNTTAVTLDGVWTVGSDPANGTKVRLGNTDQPAITLTINSGASIGPSGTGNVDVLSPISGNQKVIYKGTTAISFGNIFDSNFEIVYDGITVTSSTSKSFGTVTIINGANVTFSSTINIINLSIASNTSVTFSNLPIITNTTVNGTLVAPTTNSSFITIPSGGSLTVNGIIKIPRLSGFVSSNLVSTNTTTSGTNIQFLGTENLTLGTNSTVEYVRDASGPQIVSARLDYKNLKLSGTVPKTFNGPTVVAGTLTINQTAPATAVTMLGDLSVNESLSFTSGKITTGSNTVTIGTSGTITGADQTTGWVVGNLKKLTASNASPSFSYAIGDATNYTPLALTFTGNTSAAGGLTVKINIGDHPQIASSGLNSAKSVNKNWTLTNDNLINFGTYSAAFSYTTADIDVASTPSNYKVGLTNVHASWSPLTTLVTPAPSPLYTTTATGISDFGDFAIGESSSSIVNLTLFIEGYYVSSNTMASVKLNQDGISPADEVENITVELHDAITPYSLVPGATTTAVLKTNGTAVCTFTTAPSGSFYIVVKTSNAIQTWSANPESIGASPLSYNFSSAATQAFNSNMIETIDSGVWAFYSGDLNQDEVIDGTDAPQLTNDVENSAFGVQVTDINGDGAVDGSDVPSFDNNTMSSIFANYPLP